MAVVVSGDATLEQMSESKKKKKKETIEVDLPIIVAPEVIAPDPRKQWVKAWNDLCQHNKTGKYYEPVERQLKLITEDGFSDEMAYTAAGTHLESCNSCRCHDDNDGFMKNCFFSGVIQRMKQSGTTMQEGGRYTNTQIRCHLYQNFAEENYAYLRKLRNKSKLPCIPLPWCFEQAIKRSFPNENNQPFVGFKSSQERGKI